MVNPNATHQVNDLSEVHFHGTLIKIGEIRGVMDELGEFALSHLGGTITEDKEEGINGVGLSRTVRTND